MTTEDIIIHIFCLVDEQLPPLAKHPQAKLYPTVICFKCLLVIRLWVRLLVLTTLTRGSILHLKEFDNVVYKAKGL